MQKIDQTKIFLDQEANLWFARNREALALKSKDKDHIFQALLKYFPSFKNQKILELGASNGYRLAWLKNSGADVLGVEPSQEAVNHGCDTYGFSPQELIVESAYGYLTATEETYDCIIFGHNLYLVSPDEIPLIIAHAIRSLKTHGYIAIFDFDSAPQRQVYHHHDGVFSYKARFDEYFTWYPMMHLVQKDVFQHDFSASLGNAKQDCALSIIRKIDSAEAFPEIAGHIDL